jgi:tRNA A37 threonylcarbamoyladenosine biosynthesis protein TsaE
MLHDRAVVAVEWADKLMDTVLDTYLSLMFTTIDDDRRKIKIKASGQNEMGLIKALKAKLKI